MSEVRRFRLAIEKVWREIPHFIPDDVGPYVLYVDYASVKAQRDELARWVLGHGYIRNVDGSGWCANCHRNIGQDHKDDCPTALAEKIVKGKDS